MGNAAFIAQILGLFYLSLGVGMLLNQKYYFQMFSEIRKTASFMLFSGLLALLAGFLIVTTHNVWEDFWTGFVSLVGWIGLLKGILLLVFPTVGVALTNWFLKIKNFMLIESVLVLILGALFGWYGFLA